MPSAAQTIRLRRLRQAREGHYPVIKLGLVSALLISLAAVALSLAGIGYYVDLTRSLPSIEILPVLLDPPNGMLFQPTRLFDRDHEHILLTLENPAAYGKQYLSVRPESQAGTSRVSKYLVDATIAKLDPGFWDEAGYSLVGVVEGTHPTLAQRLVSDLLLDEEPASLTRNIRERLLAAQVTAQFGREKVLEWYLNSAQYGETLFGADAAARVYFGKSASNLSLAEAAMLTALAEKPSVNPLTGSQILAQQQEAIIQKMFVSGIVNGDEALGALKENVRFQDQAVGRVLAPAFSELVLSQLSAKMSLERIYRGGYDIVTTLDYSLQMQADCVSQAQLARLRGTSQPATTLDGSSCEASSLLPSLLAGMGSLPEDLSVEVVILEPHSGQILAMVGKDGSGMHPANPPLHPAGSSLSPFMYLAAFSRGMSPATLLWDIPDDTDPNASNPVSQNSIPGSPNNYHGPVSLREAFVNDYADAAEQVWQQVGAANVFLTGKQFGLGTPGPDSGSGTSLDSYYSQGVSLLQNTQAYSVLANQGLMVGQPGIEDASGYTAPGLSSTSVLKVESVDGRVWQDWTIPDMLPIVTHQIAYLATHVLSDEKARLSSAENPNFLEIGRPAAAKLSVPSGDSSSWAIGYIPQLTVGVWMGIPQGTEGGITAEMSAVLWHAIMQYAARDLPIQDFSVPTGVSLLQVCNPSGLLVSAICPSIVQEVFLSGSEPTQVDDLYQKYAINRETGLLATIFTPPEMVEEKVFLAVPLQAKGWAQAAGIAIPPDTYDSILASQPASTDVLINDPLMFGHVAGVIEINGSAGGEGFSYYRLQVGQGLNPVKWLQIGEDVRSPVINGTLGTWDTTGLEGLYVIQLQVVRQDSRIEQAVLQLTVDNTPPQVEIISPLDDERYPYQPGNNLMINVSATDNLVVDRVEFYIDDSLEKTLLEPPYVIVWASVPGEHILRVRAYDLAGNQTELSLPFVVSK